MTKKSTNPAVLHGETKSAKRPLSERPHALSFLKKDGTPQDSLVQTSHQEETNINNIMKKYVNTGLLPQTPKTPQYLDNSNPVTYQESLNQVREAEQDFNSLPAEMRAKFDNDPKKLLEWAAEHSPEDLNELFGIKPPPETDPAAGAPPAPAVPEPQETPPKGPPAPKEPPH